MSNSYVLTSHGELYHYGVKGMKWGVRRFQNRDGSLTPAGKKRTLREVRSDNKTAYELGKSATITGHAAAKSAIRTIKYENKLDRQYEKDPDAVSSKTRRLRQKWDASASTTKLLMETYVANKTKAENHCKSLVEKYGNELVKSIKYRDIGMPTSKYGPTSFKTMNERTNNLSDYAKSGAITVGAQAFSLVMGLPVSLISVPASTGHKASRLESATYDAYRRQIAAANKKNAANT